MTATTRTTTSSNLTYAGLCNPPTTVVCTIALCAPPHAFQTTCVAPGEACPLQAACGVDAGAPGDDADSASADADADDAAVEEASTDGALAADSRVPPSDGDGAAVSFTNDVMPIFQTSCATSGAICHGATTVSSPTATQPRPYLGVPFGTPDAPTLATIYGGIVDTPSNEDTTMNDVTPGQTDQSYLWFKITGTQDQLTSSCTNPAFSGCGLAMPFQATPLNSPDLALVQGWIEEGAPLN
jgi:hypothetical protein